MSTEWRNNPDECYGDSVFGYKPQKNIGIKVNTPTIRRLRDSDRDKVAEPTDPDSLLGPVEINEHDLASQEPTEYNPYRYVYPLVLEELNMEIVVRFQLSDLDHENLDPITFTDRDGTEHTIPLFPTVQEGKIPVQDTWEGPDDLYKYYRESERQLYQVPVIERAKVFGDGMEKEDVLITKETLESILTPERFMQALIDFRDDLRQDPQAPRPLFNLMCEMCGEVWSEGSEYYGEDDEDEDDDDYGPW